MKRLCVSSGSAGKPRLPETFTDLVDLIVPELQRRRRYKRDYAPGTLREKLYGQGVQIKEIVRIFLAASFVDTVPGGDVDDAIAATEYFLQLRPIQNGPLDKHRSLFQNPVEHEHPKSPVYRLYRATGVPESGRDFPTLRSEALSWSSPSLPGWARARHPVVRAAEVGAPQCDPPTAANYDTACRIS
jgi:hypothetical protein